MARRYAHATTLRLALLVVAWLAFAGWISYLVIHETNYDPVRNCSYYEINRPISHNERNSIYFGAGWSRSEARWRWSNAKRAEAFFLVRKEDLAAQVLWLEIDVVFTRGKQEAAVELNGHRIGDLSFHGKRESHGLPFPVAYLADDGPNELTLIIPGAAPVPGKDKRELGIALTRLRLTDSEGSLNEKPERQE